MSLLPDWVRRWLDPSAPAITYPARFELLDGLRGLAALTVVVAHLGGSRYGLEAVLVFFLISGYCIAGATDAALRAAPAGQFDLRSFMWRRVHRIYPPYLLSLAFYAVTRIVRHALDRGAGPSPDPLAWLQNLTLTQWLTLVAHPADSAAANPTLFVAAYWSLDYEEQFYLVMAIAGVVCAVSRRRLVPFLAAVTLVSIAWIAGFGSTVYHGIFVEYWLQFASGVALFLALCRATSRRAQSLFVGAIAAITLVCALLMKGYPVTVPALTGFTIDFRLLGGMALLLYGLRPFSAAIARSSLWKPIRGLGLISYSLYLVHQFNLTAAESVATWLVGDWHLPALDTAVAVATEVGIATVFWYWCERPFLNRRAAPAQRTASSPAPA